ncbi:hypothetical protein HN51_059046, partial [Arachis hypogaea]
MTERKRGSLRRFTTVQPITAAMLPPSRGTVVAVAEERPYLCELPPSKLLLLLCCFCCHAIVPLDIAASESPVTSSLLLNPLSLVLCLLIVAQPLFRPAWKEACATLQKLLS